MYNVKYAIFWFNFRNGYIEHAAYSQSKACQLMFTKVLARRLKDSSSSVQVVAVHPGVVNTELFEGTFVKLVAPWYLNLFCKVSFSLLNYLDGMNYFVR